MKKYLNYLLMFAVIIIFAHGIKAEAQSLKISAPSKNIYVEQKIQMKVMPSSMKGQISSKVLFCRVLFGTFAFHW